MPVCAFVPQSGCGRQFLPNRRARASSGALIHAAPACNLAQGNGNKHVTSRVDPRLCRHVRCSVKCVVVMLFQKRLGHGSSAGAPDDWTRCVLSQHPRSVNALGFTHHRPGCQMLVLFLSTSSSPKFIVPRCQSHLLDFTNSARI